MNTIRTAMTGAALAGLLVVSGCGSKSQDARSPQDSTQAAPTGQPGGGFDASQLKRIKSCLKAAGLADKIPDLPSDPPSGIPSGVPSGAPSGSPPSGFPTDLPSGGAGGFQDSDVQAALKACGISLQRPSAGSS